MKKLLTIILTFAITATIAQARIGWTKEECEDKYGHPTRISPIADVLDYKPEGFKLSAEFYKGKVYAISCEPETPLSEQPVVGLIREDRSQLKSCVGQESEAEQFYLS